MIILKMEAVFHVKIVKVWIILEQVHWNFIPQSIKKLLLMKDIDAEKYYAMNFGDMQYRENFAVQQLQ